MTVISKPPKQHTFMCGTVYLICWEVGHYVGFSTDVIRRFEQHTLGKGSVATKLAVKQGHELKLAQVWLHTTTTYERHIQKNFTCPNCGQEDTKKKVRVHKFTGISKCVDCQKTREHPFHNLKKLVLLMSETNK